MELLIIGIFKRTINRKLFRESPNYGGWITQGSKLLRKVLIPLDIFIGKITYFSILREEE